MTPLPPHLRPPSELRVRLLAHYDRHRRDLPWRGEADPYRVWVSEVMLQQTRVETVLPYYERWMARFPELRSLADAAVDEVLGAWEGLGYYARARRLHQAARVVRDRHQGLVPATAVELRRLPGVGEYTAGAVASIAFGEAVPAVDGNARRVLSRLLDLPDPRPSELAGVAGELVDPARPGDFNQALMELGATVCTPRSPRCGRCPVEDLCLARVRGTTEARPLRRRRVPPPEARFALAVLVEPRGRVLLVRRAPQGLLGGLWALPEVALAGGEEAEAAARRLAGGMGVSVGAGRALPPVRHAFTHLRARYSPVLFRTGRRGADVPDVAFWVDPAAPEGVALPAAQRRILREVARVVEESGRTADARPRPESPPCHDGARR